jgi:hypothetical protein
MTDKSIWDKEIPVPLTLIEYVDQGVRDSESHQLLLMIIIILAHNPEFLS